MPSFLPPARPDYSGIWAPMVTPISNGDIDYDAAARFARHLVDTGLHGLVIAGTTGEGPSLSPYEKARLLDAVTASVAGDIPVFLGLEGTSTAQMIADLAEIGDPPIDGYLMSAPGYVRPGQEGVYRHFMTVGEAVKRPVILYDIPARTGVSLHIDTIARLVRDGDFPAIKACGLSEDRLKDLLALYRLKVMCGDDHWMFHAFELGAHGAISASAQVAPRRFADAYHMLERFSADGAWKRFHVLAPLIDLLFAEPNPAPVKAALACQGWCAEELRLPMLPVTAACRERLRQILDHLHALGHEEPVCADKSSK